MICLTHAARSACATILLFLPPDADWSPLFANQRERERTGLSVEEAQSEEAFARIFHPEDLKILKFGVA